MKESSFSDVTLVSDDQKPLKAHRYVLGYFSPVLKNVLLANPHPHPLVYLRGVNHEELDSILQFIYLGKALLRHSNMKRFALAVKDLQIKKLAEIRLGDESELSMKEEIENELNNEYAGESILDIADDIINFDIPSRDESGSRIQVFKCQECEASYKRKQALGLHIKIKHDEISFSCKYCEYKAQTKSYLRIHEASVHEGVKHARMKKRNGVYKCKKCDAKFETPSGLGFHRRSKHDVRIYSCLYCDFKATDKSNLKKHQQSVQEGVRYTCD